MQFVTLDHTDALMSMRICYVMRRSYAVEAELIGAPDFPPLSRTSGQISATDATFFGFFDQEHLLAVAEVESLAGTNPNIAGFVVDPGAFRRGIGTALLRHVLDSVSGERVTVSTAAANRPAIALYEKHGFRIIRRWVVGNDIDMVTLEIQVTDAGINSSV